MAAYIEIDESKALDDLLSEAGITVAPADRDAAVADAVQFLRGLEQLPLNEQEGGVRVIIRGKHISLKTVLWQVASSSLALLPKALDPTGISQVVGAAAFGTALIGLKDKITSLDDYQLAICHAVTQVTRRKSADKKQLDQPGASPHEVIAELEQMGYTPRNVEAILKSLSGKVLKEIYYQQYGPFYKLVP